MLPAALCLGFGLSLDLGLFLALLLFVAFTRKHEDNGAQDDRNCNGSPDDDEQLLVAASALCFNSSLIVLGHLLPPCATMLIPMKLGVVILLKLILS
jgi:hypothetical protein